LNKGSIRLLESILWIEGTGQPVFRKGEEMELRGITNVDLEIKGNILTIKVDLSKVGALSKSQKSRLIATTNGNITIPTTNNIRMGLNIYVPEEK
jgi:hypothetical protein